MDKSERTNAALSGLSSKSTTSHTHTHTRHSSRSTRDLPKKARSRSAENAAAPEKMKIGSDFFSFPFRKIISQTSTCAGEENARSFAIRFPARENRAEICKKKGGAAEARGAFSGRISRFSRRENPFAMLRYRRLTLRPSQ